MVTDLVAQRRKCAPGTAVPYSWRGGLDNPCIEAAAYCKNGASLSPSRLFCKTHCAVKAYAHAQALVLTHTSAYTLTSTHTRLIQHALALKSLHTLPCVYTFTSMLTSTLTSAHA